MKQKEKARFVRNLTSAVAKAVIEDIEKMPDSWDGIDVRMYLADAFAWEAKGFKGRRRRHNREHAEARCRATLHY